MISYYPGTVFNSGAEAFVNTINCDGVMGAGIALEFGLRYPEMYDDYKRKCSERKIQIGYVDYYISDNKPTIINFPTKFNFKYPSKIQWVEAGLRNFTETCRQYEFKTVAFPKLGTNKGGLSWDEVRPLMERYLAPLPFEVIICLDENPRAEGIEKKMLDAFNKMEIAELAKKVRLTKKQCENIERKKPYSRFWKIAATEGIGAKTYEKMFTTFYQDASSEKEVAEQLSFDFF